MKNQIAKMNQHQAYSNFVKRAAESVNNKYYAGANDTRFSEERVREFFSVIEDIFGDETFGRIDNKVIDNVLIDIDIEARMARDNKS